MCLCGMYMVYRGSFKFYMDEVIHKAFISFSNDLNKEKSFEELISLLIGYGLVDLGYLELHDLPWEDDVD